MCHFSSSKSKREHLSLQFAPPLGVLVDRGFSCMHTYFSRLQSSHQGSLSSKEVLPRNAHLFGRVQQYFNRNVFGSNAFPLLEPMITLPCGIHIIAYGCVKYLRVYKDKVLTTRS